MLRQTLGNALTELQAIRRSAKAGDEAVLDEAIAALHRIMERRKLQSPDRFQLYCERREDGGLRVESPDVVGLVLSHIDPEAVMRDVMPAIDALMRHNHKR